MWKVFLCFILGLEALLLLMTQLKDNIIEEPNISYNTLNAEPPLVIGHRGASGFLPGHTLAGYLLAIEQGADVVEPDLVMTKDGVLVCRHEPVLSLSTNIKSIPEFAQRKKWKKVAGIPRHDWFIEDFTLEEIKKIGVIQSNFDRAQEYNGVFDIPTFEEVIELVKTKSAELNRRIIIYPEIKHPSFHQDSGLPIVEKVLETLEREGWNHKDSPVFLQSTEVSTLQEIRSRSTVKLMQIFLGCKLDKEGRINTDPGFCNQPYDFMKNKDKRTYSDLATDEGLDFLKTYADIIGVWTPFVIPFTFQDLNNDDKPDDINGDGIIDFRDFTALPPTDLVERAHQRGLLVHVYTTKNEPSTLLSNYEGDPMKEYEALFQAGVDGIFADFPTTALTARELYF